MEPETVKLLQTLVEFSFQKPGNSEILSKIEKEFATFHIKECISMYYFVKDYKKEI